MIAITFALPAESSDFVNLLTEEAGLAPHCAECITGHLHNQPVAVFHTGVGEKSCRPRIERLLQEQPFKYLISAGFAGGLTEHLKIGDLFVSQNFTSPELLESLHSIGGTFHRGKLVTARRIIDTKAERERLATETKGAAVDMETEFIVTACLTRRIPMLSLRVISDTPSEPLPAPANVLFDLEHQKTDYGHLARYLATHPHRLGPLLAFRRRVVHARETLTRALDQLMRVDLVGLIGPL